MAISKDLYITKLLLENTKTPNSKIPWQRKDSGGYFAIINNGENPIKIEVTKVPSRPWPRIFIKLSSADIREVELQEPIQKVFTLRNDVYDSQEDSDLAESMKELLATISHQLNQKDLKDRATEEERKQKILELCQNVLDN